MKHRSVQVLLIALLLAAVLAACSQEEPTPTIVPEPTEAVQEAVATEPPPATEPVATPAETTPLGPTTTVADITDRPWLLVAFGDAENPDVVEQGTAVTIVFNADGTFNGSGGCNNYFGQFTADDSGTMAIASPIGSTMMACDVGGAQEVEYLAALEGVTGYSVNDEGRLVLAYSSEAPFAQNLVYTLAEQPLTGTTWRLVSWGSPDDPQPVMDGTVVTAEFAADEEGGTTGTLAGNATCNRYTTTYAIDGDSLTVSPIATTMMACAIGDEQEAAFLGALQSAQTFAISGSTLTITYDGGELVFSSLNLPLEEVLWQALMVAGQPVPEDVVITAVFYQGDTAEEARVAGTSGCNNYTAGFETDGDSLTVGPIAGTMMFCPSDEANALEQAYTAALGAAQTFSILGEQMVVSGPEGDIVFAADRDPLEGTLWTLVSWGAADEQRTPPEGTAFTATFDRVPGVVSGIVSGGTGCNDYNATYAANLTEIKINLPQKSRNEDCPAGDGQLEAEQQFFLGLNAASTYRILGQTLQLPYDGQVLTFEATPPPVDEGEPALDLTPLANTFWYLSAFGDAPVMAGTEITAQFAVNDDGITGAVSGSGGCNSYNAALLANFQVGPIVSTQRACDQAIMNQEGGYFDWLGTAQGFSRAGDQLLVPTARGVLVYNSSPILDQSYLLPGVTWHLVSYEALRPIAGANPTVVFDANGTSLSGTTGCNNYTGAFRAQQGNTLAISDIGTTFAACATDQLTQQQDTFVRLMVSAVSYSVNNTILQIRTVDGGTMNFSSIAPAQPVAPTAVINGPTQADAGQALTFDANGSTAGSSPIVRFAWDMGDGTLLNGRTVQYSYATPGTYTVSLTAVDQAGRTSTATQAVQVNAVAQVVPPTAAITGPALASVGEQVTFSAAGSTPGSGAIASFAWQSGDGNNTEALASDSFTTVYGRAGTYFPSVTVFSADGLSDTASMAITVNATLEGPTWVLSTAAPDTSITLRFANGQLQGFAGCNTYNATYASTMMAGPSNTIMVGPITSTSQLCAEEIMAQETAYLGQLQTAGQYTIDGDTLTLQTDGGPLTFIANYATTLPAPAVQPAP